MGVTKLWTIVEDSGKPVRLESLRKKRLAIDASIWVYQFLKAVRNKEGEGLKGSHIVGFFRRICKLLYFGIKPVFVFDGGAPIIKLNTIAKRRERREGQRQSAKGTAQRLLLIKMKKLAEEEKRKKIKEDNSLEAIKEDIGNKIKDDDEFSIFKKEDDYHLPEVDKFVSKITDKRVVNPDDYRKYMESLDDNIDDIDLNDVDPASEEFSSLSLEKQYILLRKLRLRSRLRMGYSRDQLQDLFPNSLDFSKFQIEMVTKRNFLTQKLLNVVGLDDSLPDLTSSTKRLAGENDRSYTIQRSENGWSLSLENGDGTSAKPISLLDVEDGHLNKKPKLELRNHVESDDDDEENFDDVEWEDVKIDKKSPRKNFSLNSLPLPPASENYGLRSKVAFASLEHRDLKEDMIEEVNEDEVEEMMSSVAVEKSLNEVERKYQEELKRVIETSKKDLESIRVEQEKFLDHDMFDIGGPQKLVEKPKFSIPSLPLPPKISLGKSIFSKSNTDYAKKNEKKSEKKDEKKDESKDEKKDDQESDFEEQFSDDDFEEVAKAEECKVASNEMPAWFDSKLENRLQDIHTLKNNFEEKDTESKAESEKDEETDVLITNVHLDSTFEKRVKELSTDNDDLPVLELGEENTRPKEIIELDDDSQKEEIILDANESDYSKSEKINKEDTTNKENDDKENIEADIEANKPNEKKIKFYEFDEAEEEDIVNDLKREEEANEEFANNLKRQYQPTSNFNREDYLSESQLQEQHKRELRDSDEVTDVMIEEVKDLLTCFGIPYITAPMEAEAQCSELLNLGLVDGVVTDDSDCFLFGGDKIYRHMFTEKKFAEFYEIKDIEKKKNLNRDSLIDLAFLLGSDYTEGLKGIGPVTAMKIINEFGNLKNFRDWCVKCQDGVDKSLLTTSFKKSLRKRLINNEIFLDTRFPDPHVRNAYLHPEVDDDNETFVWGAPDLDMLRNYLMNKIGWNAIKINEILIPLVRRYNSPW